MKDKFMIIDILSMDFMKNKGGKIKYYDTEEEARSVCGIYEFENVWIIKLIYHHNES